MPFSGIEISIDNQFSLTPFVVPKISVLYRNSTSHLASATQGLCFAWWDYIRIQRAVCVMPVEDDKGHNDFWRNSALNTRGLEMGPTDLEVDPQFVDAVSGNYRLASDSPLRGAGKDGLNIGKLFPEDIKGIFSVINKIGRAHV